MKGSYLWNTGNSITDLRLIVEGAVTLFEEDASSIGKHMMDAGELIAALHRCTDISDVIGTVNEEAGAWIRFNPMDGKDVRNDNVTAFNYALVESDSQDIEKQYALMQELQLPIAMLVHSGGKSLPANLMERREKDQ